MKSIILSFLALCLVGCAAAEATQDAPPKAGGTARAGDALKLPASAGTRVEVATLGPSEARLKLRLPGEVKGSREALLAAPMGGLVESVHVPVGQSVKAGALLARVDSAPYAVQLEQAKADVELAAADLARNEKMGDLGTAAQRQALRTRLRVARAGLKAAQIRMTRTRITAPFGGTIAQNNLEVGEVVGPGAPVLRLVKLDPVVVELSVSDRDVTALREGMEVSVIADATLAPRRGKIARISPAGDLKTRSFTVEVEVPNADRSLLPGMIASAQISEVVAREAIVIPQDWLVTRLDGLGLYAEVDGVATWRPVTVGSVVGDQAVIADGVRAGERVVIKGQRDLAPGDALVVARSGQCCALGRATF